MTVPEPKPAETECSVNARFFEALSFYSKRPKKIEWMNFGHWINEACGLNDRKLASCVTTSEAKRILYQRDYWKDVTAKKMWEFNKESV